MEICVPDIGLSPSYATWLFNGKHNQVFGRGGSHGCYMWLLVGHRPDSRLQSLSRVIAQRPDSRCLQPSSRSSHVNDRSSAGKVITLRVCIQNIDQPKVTVPLDEQAYEVLFRSDENTTQQRLACSHARMIAMCGSKVPLADGSSSSSAGSSSRSDASQHRHLKAYESMVLEIDVLCPLDVHTETDFLTRAVGLNLSVQVCTPIVPRRHEHGELHDDGTEEGHENSPLLHETRRDAVIRSEFVDEEEVWDSYMELPGTRDMKREENRKKCSRRKCTFWNFSCSRAISHHTTSPHHSSTPTIFHPLSQAERSCYAPTVVKANQHDSPIFLDRHCDAGIINNQSTTISHQSPFPVIHRRQSVISHQSSVISHQSPVISHQSSFISH